MASCTQQSRQPSPAPIEGSIAVTPWRDPVIDQMGVDPRSLYVEEFWLGILGPSTTWLMRRVAAFFDASPEGFLLPVIDTARSLGLGAPHGKNSPFIRSITRGCQFKLARWEGEVLSVRKTFPPLSQGQVRQLPETLQNNHTRWQQQQLMKNRPDLAALAQKRID